MTTLFKCLISILIVFAAYAHATVRVLPCDISGCADKTLVKQTVLEATKDLPEGNHKVYVHNIETEQTVYYTVRIIRETEVFQSNRIQSTVLRRTAVSGPFPAEPEAAEYIKLVYRLERSFFQEYNITPPGAETSFLLYQGYHISNFPAAMQWLPSPLAMTITNFGSLRGQTLGFNFVAARIHMVLTAYIANALSGPFGNVPDEWSIQQYIHNRLVQLQMTYSNASNWQVNSSVSGRIPLIGSAQAGGTASGQSGTSLQFSTSFLPPKVNIIFADGVITVAYDPKTGMWNLVRLVDAEGQIIYFQDNKLQFKGTYHVTDKNQALYQMIFRIMRMYNLINRAQFVRMTRVGSVFTCEGWGPCTSIDPNDDDENDHEQK